MSRILTTIVCVLALLGAGAVTGAGPVSAQTTTRAMPGSQSDGSGPGDPEQSGVPITGTTTQTTHSHGATTVTLSGVLPGCHQPGNACAFTMTGQSGRAVRVSGAALSSQIRDAQRAGELSPDVTKVADAWCFPTSSGTQCFTYVYYNTWSQNGCYVTCGSNEVTHYGKFWRTPNGSFVWETAVWNGIVGYHYCRFDHSIGMSFSDFDCTAPRYAPDSIHSHFWFTVTFGWVASERYLLSARHYGNGVTTFYAYSM